MTFLLKQVQPFAGDQTMEGDKVTDPLHTPAQARRLEPVAKEANPWVDPQAEPLSVIIRYYPLLSVIRRYWAIWDVTGSEECGLAVVWGL